MPLILKTAETYAQAATICTDEALIKQQESELSSLQR